MNCPQCTNEMIKAVATNFGDEYNYCRHCKKELKEMISTQEALNTLFDFTSILTATEAMTSSANLNRYVNIMPPPTQGAAPPVPAGGGLYVFPGGFVGTTAKSPKSRKASATGVDTISNAPCSYDSHSWPTMTDFNTGKTCICGEYIK